MTTSSPASPSRPVVVVGGGVLGVSTALHLSRRGTPVHLITAGTPGDGASGRSLAWLNSFGPRSRAYHELRLLGLDRYRTWSWTHPDAASYLRFDGGLTWAPADDPDPHRAAFDVMHASGYAAEWVSADDVAARFPGVAPTAIPAHGAIFNASEGWVDLPGLIAAMLAELAERGGRVTTDAGACEVVVEDGRVAGVRTGAGETVPADTVLLATGAAVPAAAAALGIAIDDQTPVALLVRTAPIDNPPAVVLNTPRVAIRPNADGSLVLDSAWSEEEVEVRADGSHHVRDETVRGLLKEAAAVLDGSPELVCVHQGVGPKPIPGDGEPVLGPLPGVAGLHVAFTHSGATLGLIAGELLADELATETPHPLLEPFRPSRFQ